MEIQAIILLKLFNSSWQFPLLHEYTSSKGFSRSPMHPLLEPEFNRSKSPICAALDSDRGTP